MAGGLATNTSLRELVLTDCFGRSQSLAAEDLVLLADALAVNSTLQVLGIVTLLSGKEDTSGRAELCFRFF